MHIKVTYTQSIYNQYTTKLTQPNYNQYTTKDNQYTSKDNQYTIKDFVSEYISWLRWIQEKEMNKFETKY